MEAYLLLGLFAVIVVFCLVVFRGPPYVPSKPSDVRLAFDELYSLGPDDLVVDIGSGDGLVLRAAARRGARGVGYELNPILVLISRWLNRKHTGLEVKLQDFWHAKVPRATTVIYVFGASRDIEKMASWVESQATRLGHELYFISYGFQLNRPVLRSRGAHHLYQIDPLQPGADSV